MLMVENMVDACVENALRCIIQIKGARVPYLSILVRYVLDRVGRVNVDLWLHRRVRLKGTASSRIIRDVP